MNKQIRLAVTQIFKDPNLTKESILAMGFGEISRGEEFIKILDSVRESLQEVIDEEQEKFNNMPEGLQSSERGSTIEEGISTLEEACVALDEASSISEEAPESMTEMEVWIESILDKVQEARELAESV